MVQRKEVDQFGAFIAGGYPFDTLKVKLQTSHIPTTLRQTFTQTLAREGPRGLYRGITSPLLGVTPMWALSFWSYEIGQRIAIAARPSGQKRGPMTMAEIAFAGCCSSVPTTVIVTPMERLKVILQTQSQNPNGVQYRGMWDAVKGVLREGGVAGLYRGTVATLLRDIPGGAVYFVAYEFTYRTLKENNVGPVPAALVAGGMSGVGMWCAVLPVDVVKSRIQASKAGTYKGVWDCAAQIWKEGGVRALYKGFGPAMIRAFPANAAGWMGRMGGLELYAHLKDTDPPLHSYVE
ncbi:carnitine transporter [Podochytrium sp. JEL0797]|nr:carnitine transporter [Podochytrium sp. JEL0797]